MAHKDLKTNEPETLPAHYESVAFNRIGITSSYRGLLSTFLKHARHI